jgi:Mg/Co/Ni transporter MgtE
MRTGRDLGFLETCETIPRVMQVADWFAERSARGMLTRMVGAWLLVGLPVIAARIWWSPAAAVAVFVVTVTLYVAGALRYMRRHRPQP